MIATSTVLERPGRPPMYRDVHHSFENDEACAGWIKHGDGATLQRVPYHLRSRSICEAAVRRHGDDLRHAPAQLITAELCELAVKANPWSLRHVPSRLKSPALCKLAVDQDPNTIGEIPEELRTESLCQQVTKAEPCLLRLVPVAMRTLEMCRAAVARQGVALLWVPAALRDENPDLCELALCNDSAALPFVPMSMLFEPRGEHRAAAAPTVGRPTALLRATLRRDPWALQHLPEPARTLEVCVLAAGRERRVLRLVPTTLISEVIALLDGPGDRPVELTRQALHD
jgi:hypothetical protein